MMLEDMGQYLQNRGAGVVGKTLFLSRRPHSPTECATLYEYEGRSPNQAAGMEAPGLQVCVRARRYSDGYAMMQAAHDALKQIGFEEGEASAGVTVNGVQYFRAEPALSGVTQDMDEDGNLLLRRSYYIYKEEE